MIFTVSNEFINGYDCDDKQQVKYVSAILTNLENRLGVQLNTYNIASYVHEIVEDLFWRKGLVFATDKKIQFDYHVKRIANDIFDYVKENIEDFSK